jgi:hypothetical protein
MLGVIRIGVWLDRTLSGVGGQTETISSSFISVWEEKLGRGVSYIIPGVSILGVNVPGESSWTTGVTGATEVDEEGKREVERMVNGPTEKEGPYVLT